MPSLCEGVTKPRPVVSIPGPVFEIDVRGSTLFAASAHLFSAVETGELVAVDLKTLQQRDIPRPQSHAARSLASSAAAVYWLEVAEQPLQFELWSWALNSPAQAQRLWSGALATDVLVVNDQVFFGGPQGLLRYSKGGAVSEPAADVNVLNLATDGQYVYWSACQTKDAIRRVPLTGGAVQTVLQEGYCPGGLVTDGTDVFFFDQYDAEKGLTSTLQRVPVSGGKAQPVAIVIETGGQLQLDAASLYFGASDGVYRVDRATSTTSLVINGPVSALANDEHCLYWAPRDSYSVFTIAK